MIRDDISDKLIHLTRGSNLDDAAKRFVAILHEKKLLGGTSDIKGGSRCVCFSEAPISKLGQILASPDLQGMRYKPFGIMIDKKWLFERGGRPVIYQPDSEYELLHEEQKFRHKCYNPKNNVDLTWEREWRIRINELPIDPETITVVVPNREWVRKILQSHEEMVQRFGIVIGMAPMPMSIIKSPWHFIALEDFGVPIPV